jgi:crotonobetainyl-CoA:carnitine CoA-transferase CaiB-like acyl-CoA transferase
MGEAERPLAGVKVIDCATLFAGPVIASLMGDFGADVIKVEHPRGDTLRSLGWVKDGVSLWWTLASRNKRCVTLDLSKPEGQDIVRELVAEADVFIENFRPGTLERWGIGPETLHAINDRLVIVRTTAFGQTGPYAQRPGFGTLAESISGYASINGWADKPPALPPFALGDGVAALTGTFATMIALWWRDTAEHGRGQVIDLSIYEPLFWLLGPQVLVYDQLGLVQGRTGNAAPFAAPRNAYLTRDGRWLGLSASAQSIAERVMRVIGRPDLAAQPWFVDNAGRVEHADELDAAIQAWIGERTADEVMLAFEEAGAAIAPMYSVDELVEDPHYLARETIVRVPHPVLGPVLMQNVIPRLETTPGAIRFPAREIGADNDDIYGDDLGLSADRREELRARGVI